MKRVCLLAGLISLITLIVAMAVLLVMAIINNNNYSINDSIVFIESLGSDSIKDGMGFVYKIDDNTNYIITNYHVISDSNSLYVYNIKNKKLKASIVDYDSYTDIAVIEVENKLNLKEVKIGNNNVKEEDEVNYFNIDNRLIDSAKVLSLDNEINLSANYGNSFYKAVSINGNIKAGNSGSPIFNKYEEVIGLISLKEQNSDIAYYISIDNVMNVVSKLENHTLMRPNIGGVFASTSNTEVLNKYGIVTNGNSGVVVIEVTDNYPLNISGLIKGDIINKVNDVVISDVSDLQREIYSYDIGDTVTLEYYRNNILSTVNVVLSK